MTPEEFIGKWEKGGARERQSSHPHFFDFCKLLGVEQPTERDEEYGFEKRAVREGVPKGVLGKGVLGEGGWADVWKRGCFVWEYKSEGSKDWEKAFTQLRRYALALENPPLLVASDMKKVVVRTAFTFVVSERHEFLLEDLRKEDVRRRLKAMFSRERVGEWAGRKREEITKGVVEDFAELVGRLRGRKHDSQEVARFVNRLVFCMYAENDGYLPPSEIFKEMLDRKEGVEALNERLKNLFGAMAEGGWFGLDKVKWFNGGLFEDDATLPLEVDDLRLLRGVSTKEWSDIDPSILGELFERMVNPQKNPKPLFGEGYGKRGKEPLVGVHYTSEKDIMRIVKPVVTEPLLAEWEETKREAQTIWEEMEREVQKKKKKKKREAVLGLVEGFLDRIRNFVVLDPACGSGNFLYLALRELKNLELLVQTEAERDWGRRVPMETSQVTPERNLRGIEINPYAAELARLSVWLGELQWWKMNMDEEEHPEPILGKLDGIECRDALITKDGREAEWQKADVIIGNPPFLGRRKRSETLSADSIKELLDVYGERIPSLADLVCYWFYKAYWQVQRGAAKRVGLVATNSIRDGDSRRVLDTIVQDLTIFDAWSDEEWMQDGAQVHVSIVCFAKKDAGLPTRLDGKQVERIHSNLEAKSYDLTKALKLGENRGVATNGVFRVGLFDVQGEEARKWLLTPNPNGKHNADVLSPWANGEDIVRRPRGMWIVDFGVISEKEAELYEQPFRYVAQEVRPVRLRHKIKKYRENWWLHAKPSRPMAEVMTGKKRYIATPQTSKHRVFVWLDVRVCPDIQVVAILRDDDATFGVLHSRFHKAWSLRLGSTLETRPRYTHTETFRKFPFPKGMTLDMPADEFTNPHAQEVAEAARRLNELRENWLNPPEWVDLEDEVVAGYPKRPVPKADAGVVEGLKERTLTKLYNERPAWLDSAHKELDAAVAAAYGWDADITKDDALEALLELNLSRSAEERVKKGLTGECGGGGASSYA